MASITVSARSQTWTVFAARRVGSWDQIPLEAWMFMCVYSVFMLFCMQVAALRRADPPSKESYRLCIGLRNWKSGRSPKRKRKKIYLCLYSSLLDLGRFFSFLNPYAVGKTPWTGDQHRRKAAIYTQNNTNTEDIYASSGIQTHDPSVQASKDSSCLVPHGHCDRHINVVIWNIPRENNNSKSHKPRHNWSEARFQTGPVTLLFTELQLIYDR
jgi:hypothetical protein